MVSTERRRARRPIRPWRCSRCCCCSAGTACRIRPWRRRFPTASSFIAFVGLSLEDETPDHATIWRFRQKLGEAGLVERLFDELARQLEASGAVLKQGTLIDASLVTSAARRPRVEDGKTSPVDPDARFGTGNERGRFAFGYKMHVAVDQGSGLVQRVLLTGANVQEVTVAPDLVADAAGTVYADRAYDSDAMRADLAARGLGDGVMRRARGRPLRPPRRRAICVLSLIRRAVEPVFGTLKRCYGLVRMRHFNAPRNRTALVLACMAFNLRRWRVIAVDALCPIAAKSRSPPAHHRLDQPNARQNTTSTQTGSPAQRSPG